MDLEREIELLKEKVKLLETVKELQDQIKVAERPRECPAPYIPYCPPVYPGPVWPQTPWYEQTPYRWVWTSTTDYARLCLGG